MGQSEMLPAVAARVIWRENLRHRLVIHFIDNDAARFAMIKGTSPTKDSAWLTSQIWCQEAANQSCSWFERVPSASNPADAPSRGRAPEPPAAGFTPKRIDLPKDWEIDLVYKWWAEAAW